MRDLSAERQASYRQLAAIVDRLVAGGQGTRSARLKPALKYTSESFDENLLGFRSFRAFLEAAAEAGFVVLRRAPIGPDVDVLPAHSIQGMKAEDHLGSIRRDMWAAFVNWNADWCRFYDKETNRVAWVPAIQQPDEDEPYASVRKAIAAAPERYVPIEPTRQNGTLDWMNAFIETLDASESGSLRAALSGPWPIRAFVLTARENGVESRWRSWRFQRVLERMNDWASANQIELDLIEEREPLSPPPHPPRVPFGRQPRATPARGIPLEELRERVCVAVRRMSRAELLRLAIPLEYVLEDDGR